MKIKFGNSRMNKVLSSKNITKIDKVNSQIRKNGIINNKDINILINQSYDISSNSFNNLRPRTALNSSYQ